jgi:hypothetical protein
VVIVLLLVVAKLWLEHYSELCAYAGRIGELET